MDKVPLWKPLLIVVLTLLAAWELYPLDQKLRQGPDLVGGTTLLYQVNVPDRLSGNPEREIDETISILQNRVDPAGVRNLVWRQQTGHRIEILMPQASEAAANLRKAYVASREALLKTNVSPRTVESALRADAEHRARLLDQLAQGDKSRQAQLNDLVAQSDAANSAKKPYDAVQAKQRDLEAKLEKLPPTASEADRKQVEDAMAKLQPELTRLAREYLEVRKGYDAAKATFLAGNIDPSQVELALSLSNKRPERSADGKSDPQSERELAMDKLIASHPNRKAEITSLFSAYESYEGVKGDLDDPNDLIELLKGSGVLEFRIGASPSLPEASEYREQLRTKGPRSGGDKPYRWFPVDDLSSFAEKSEDQDLAKASPAMYFAQRQRLLADAYAGQIYLLLANSQSDSITDQQHGWQVSDAYATSDSLMLPAIGFELNPLGGDLMGSLTSSHKGQPMAIVLDGKVMTAPNINDTIHGRGQITGHGGFSQKQVDYLVRTLKAGSLKARLSERPISIQKTGPQLGKENLHSGLYSAILAFVLVAIFMAAYYFFMGMVANVALMLNILFTLAVMAMFEASFTLPGIAGVVLAIGMAVDTNVLIYERIREELELGKPLRNSIRLGYDKALITIIDVHLTTLLTCVILGYLATADIRGFAVTLGIGLVANLFTAVFCSRVAIDYYVQWFNPKSLSMVSTTVPAVRKFLHPNVDWVGKKAFYIGFSAVLTVIGLVAIVARGVDFFDIEFRGGTQVSFNLARDTSGNLKSLSTQEVKDRLAIAAKAPGLEKLADVTPVTIGDVVGGKASSFTIQTLVTDSKAVSEAIKTSFADVLDVQFPIQFAGLGAGDTAPPINQAPVFLVRDGNLGTNINRPAANDDVSEYIGGVATVIDQMTPATTVDDIQQRIQRIRFQPGYEELGYRQFSVIGLDQAPDQAGRPKDAQPLYKSVVILSREDLTNYSDNPDTFTDPKGLASTEWKLIRDALRRDTSLESVSNFSAQVSGTMKQQAILAVVLSWVMIMIYIWFRFGSIVYGLGAIIAMIHDVIVAVGFAALAFYVLEWVPGLGHALQLQPFRIDLSMIAAVLTLIGYSVNDTIVVFDRIRENRGDLAYTSAKVINDSINQTISRTVLTVFTVLLAVFVLYLFGGPGIKGFAFIMLVGALIGCYSSIAVASPLLLLIHRPQKK